MGGVCCAGPSAGEEARIADKPVDKNRDNGMHGPMTKRQNVDSVANQALPPEDRARQ